MANIILSAFADEYAENFKEQLEGMSSLGIGYIELRGVNGKNVSTLSRDEVKEAKNMLDCYGIKVSSIGSPVGKVQLDSDLDAHLDMTKRILETANELQSDYVRMFSFYAPEGQRITECKDKVFSELARLSDAAAAAGVTLCHENEARIYGDVPERCNEILCAFDNIKCVFDMGNFALDGIAPYPAYELYKDKIAYFHIKDALAAGAIVPPGCGEAEIAKILKEHKAYATSDFFISLEPHLQLFSGLNKLAHVRFENPYKYNSMPEAFVDAYNRLKELIS